MSGWRALWCLCAVLLLSLWPSAARADVDLELNLSARTVGVGEPFRVDLSAMSQDGDAPQNPQLTAPDAFEVQGPTVGTRQQVSISGMRMVRQSGIGATWILSATRPGIYSIGPASVRTPSGEQRSAAVQIQVLDQPNPANRLGGRRRQRGPDPFDPFDSFGGLDPLDDMLDRMRRRSGPDLDRLPSAPDGIAIESPPDPTAFVLAKVDKTSAVVGEQVTLSLYAYGGRGMFQEASGAREPALQDFLAQRLVEDPSRQPVYQFMSQGRPWIAVKVRELALFPLRSGDLEIGPLKFGFLGRRYPDEAQGGGGLWRSSQTLHIAVSEPPAAGRPAGYTGEVGDFALAASVDPRTVEAGAAVAVSATVKGEGRLPSALKLPEQAGVDWLEPTLTDQASVNDSRVGGSRRFSYVVRLSRPGEIDLGQLSLPFYDPSARQYRVRSVALGKVTVTPSAQAAAAPSAATGSGPRLSELATLRLTPGAAPPPARYFADRLGFWALLLLGPGLVLAGTGAQRAARALRAGWRRRDSSESAQAAQALKQAKLAHKDGDFAGVASGIERALYRALAAATGLKLRAVMRSELAATLVRAGVERPLAEKAVSLLDTCDHIRFARGQGVDAEAQIRVAEELLKELARKPAPRSSAALAPSTEGS
jgi:oxygen tolerance protein BatD